MTIPLIKMYKNRETLETLFIKNSIAKDKVFIFIGEMPELKLGVKDISFFLIETQISAAGISTLRNRFQGIFRNSHEPADILVDIITEKSLFDTLALSTTSKNFQTVLPAFKAECLPWNIIINLGEITSELLPLITDLITQSRLLDALRNKSKLCDFNLAQINATFVLADLISLNNLVASTIFREMSLNEQEVIANIEVIKKSEDYKHLANTYSKLENGFRALPLNPFTESSTAKSQDCLPVSIPLSTYLQKDIFQKVNNTDNIIQIQNTLAKLLSKSDIQSPTLPPSP